MKKLDSMKINQRLGLHLFLWVGLILFSPYAQAQIDLADSSAQVIGYWMNQEVQSYEISLETYTVSKEDTSSMQTIKYKVDISVLDSTSSDYLIQWVYKDYEVNTQNPFLDKMVKMGENLVVKVRTNELGVLQEVINWKEIREFMWNAGDMIKRELGSDPTINKFIDRSMKSYNSEEAIRSNTIHDILQFYTLHGAKYPLGEQLSGVIQVRNNAGGEPIDTNIWVSLDEINVEDDYAVFSVQQSINPEKLTDATYEFLKQSGTLGANLPRREAFPGLTSDTWIYAVIHGSSGWPIYSEQLKEVSSVEGTIRVEERIISYLEEEDEQN
ncbi:hypothetical protein IFO69_09290 [Echinicola sp. CAU 1574]|uniref:Uncharacterized protein n=1 Tax=Echinicola arenosa TaxID=2774144 RepID=A0ABR9AJD3_9BACT|nr:hypothetical protein [Echinicola arenosa]MBD8488937.1 hypothetical protein [Echinicola arenosa]